MTAVLAPAADVVAQFLIDRGAAVASNPAPASGQWGVTVGGLPAQGGDNALAVTDGGTFPEGRLGHDKAWERHPTVFITIRSGNYGVGFAKGATLVELFDKVGVFPALGGLGRVPVVVDGVTYILQAAHVTVTPVKIGEEEKNRRQLFSMNVKLTL